MSLLEQNEIYLMILALPFVSSMLYDFFQKGMIFEFYGNWLFKEDYWNDEIKKAVEKLIDEKERLDDEIMIKKIQQHIMDLEVNKKETPFYKKPLGNCLKCFHIWVCIIFTLIFLNKDIADINILRWIASIGISYFILTKQNYE